MYSWLKRSWLFSRRAPAEGAWGIVKWWELRRIPYNLLVGLTGVLSGLVSLTFAVMAERRGLEVPWPDPPLFVLVVVGLYGVAANVCFTAGWMSELVARRIWGARAEAYGEISFCVGTVFSVLLTLFPTLLSLAPFHS